MRVDGDYYNCLQRQMNWSSDEMNRSARDADEVGPSKGVPHPKAKAQNAPGTGRHRTTGRGSNWSGWTASAGFASNWWGADGKTTNNKGQIAARLDTTVAFGWDQYLPKSGNNFIVMIL